MELDAAKRCFSHLKQAGLKVDVFVSDHHKGIGKWIWTEEQETQHFNDIWHVNKGIFKVLRKTSREKECEIIWGRPGGVVVYLIPHKNRQKYP